MKTLKQQVKCAFDRYKVVLHLHTRLVIQHYQSYCTSSHSLLRDTSDTSGVSFINNFQLINIWDGEMELKYNISTFLLVFMKIVEINCSNPHQDYFSAASEMAKLFEWEKNFLDSLSEFKSSIHVQHKSRKKYKIISSEIGTKLKNNSSKFPSSMDQVDGVLNGLFLLQDLFNLNISQFAGGSISIAGLSPEIFSSHLRLKYEDLDLIAKTAYNRQVYHRAVEWFREAVEAARNTRSKDTLITAKNLLQTTIKVHDKILDQKGPKGSSNGKSWRTNIVPYDEKLRKKKRYKNSMREALKKENGYKMQYVQHLHHPALTDQFHRLCRGEQLLVANQTNNVFCKLLHHQNPYLRVGPFKVDDQSKSPYITVFRDFFSDSEMDHYKIFARDRLERSGYGSGSHRNNDGTTTGILRTSKQTWISEFDEVTLFSRLNMTKMSIGPYLTRHALDDIVGHTDKHANAVSDRIMKATSTYARARAGGEHFQIANYGLGGFYNHHPDPFMWHHVNNKKHEDHVNAEITMIGDRVATFMGYLSDTQLGGGTAFPNVGITVKVILYQI